MEHYHKTAMPTSTQWWAPYPVDPEQICTRLPWEKEEQTPAVLSHKEVSHYTERFSKKATNKPVPMTIAVHGRLELEILLWLKGSWVGQILRRRQWMSYMTLGFSVRNLLLQNCHLITMAVNDGICIFIIFG